jgi:hypothetical protein
MSSVGKVVPPYLYYIKVYIGVSLRRCSGYNSVVSYNRFLAYTEVIYILTTKRRRLAKASTI